MKFYEIDLAQIVPYEMPVNTDSHVEPTGYINDFFLKGFEAYFKSLFTVDGDVLGTDYSRSCMAPVTYGTCAFCTTDQLQDAITEAGFMFYSANSHYTNAKFLHDITVIPFGSEKYLTAVAQYIANSDVVEAYATYSEDNPYRYTINFVGDITATENVETITSRMIENLKIVGTAHTLVTDFTFEDTGTEVGCYIGVAADDAVNEYDTDLKLPREDSHIVNDFLSIAFTANASLNNLPLKGSTQLPGTYISTNTSRYHMYDFIYLCPVVYESSVPYPLIGYSDLYLYYYSSSRTYLCNDAQFMPQELDTTGTSIKAFRVNESTFNGRSYTEFKKEKMYNNLGVRQQVFSVVTNGYRRYLDAHTLFTQAKAPVMSELDLAEHGYYRDKHFYAFVATSGLPAQVSSSPVLMYYRTNATATTATVDHTFLYDDAYEYTIEGIYRGTGEESLGDIFSSTVSEITQDDNGNPINLNNFTVSFDSHHNLQIAYANPISNVIFVRFSIKQKENCLVMYPSATGSLTGIPATNAANVYRIYSASIQPNTTIESNRFGNNMSCYGVYSCSYSNFKPKYFRNVTEAQAFLGQCNSDALFTFNSSVETVVDGNYTKIKASSESIQKVAFISCSFESLHYETVELNWNNPNTNRTYAIAHSDNLCFGTNQRYSTATTYIVDEVNGDSSLASLVSVKVRNAFNTIPSYIDLTYHGDSSVTSITSIKIHGSYPDD